MNKIRLLIVLACTVVLATQILAGAVSYPISEEHRLLAEKSVAKVGATVFMFHSGTPDVTKSINMNDNLIVIGSRHGNSKIVGKIRVVSYLGEYYLKGEVIEGEIRHDDVAKKGGASCLVIFESEMLQ